MPLAQVDREPERGVFIDYGSKGNTIGGTTAAARNVISGNLDCGRHPLHGRQRPTRRVPTSWRGTTSARPPAGNLPCPMARRASSSKVRAPTRSAGPPPVPAISSRATSQRRLHHELACQPRHDDGHVERQRGRREPDRHAGLGNGSNGVQIDLFRRAIRSAGPPSRPATRSRAMQPAASMRMTSAR